MKRTTGLALTATALVLAGCGSATEPPAAATVTVTVAESATPEPTTEAPAETSEPTTEAPAATSEPASTPSAAHTPGQQSSRGNIIKALVEEAGVTSEDGELYWSFVVTKIETGFKCTSGFSDPPKNGNYIAIHIESETTPALAEDEYDTTVTFIPSEFTVFSSDGTRENDSEGNAYSCLSSSDQMPAIIGPGEKTEGIVVLDSKHETGTIVFQPGVLASSGGWEWNF